MAERGVNVPPGIPVSSVDEVAAAAAAMSGGDPDADVVVKAQVLAGGRGLGRFASGLQGGVHIVKARDAPALAAKMLGGTLVTKQTGAAGKPVNTLLVAKKMALAREMYLAILLDRKSAGPVVVACSEGEKNGGKGGERGKRARDSHTNHTPHPSFLSLSQAAPPSKTWPSRTPTKSTRRRSTPASA